MVHFEHLGFQTAGDALSAGLPQADQHTRPQLFPKQYVPLSVVIQIDHSGTAKKKQHKPDSQLAEDAKQINQHQFYVYR